MTEVDNGLGEIRKQAIDQLVEVTKGIFNEIINAKDTEDFVKKSYGADLANDHISNNGYSYNEAFEFFENAIPKEKRDDYIEKVTENLDNYLSNTIIQCKDNDDKILKIHRIYDCIQKINEDIDLDNRVLVSQFSVSQFNEQVESVKKNTHDFNEKIESEKNKENLLKDKEDILAVEKMSSDEIFAILAERDEMERKMKEEEKTEKELANKTNEKREERRKERENLTKSQKEAKVAREEAEKAKEEANSIFAGKKLKQKAEKAKEEAKAKESVVEEINKKIVDLEENIKALGNLESLANTEKQKYTEKKLIDDSEIEKFEKQLNSMKKSIEDHKDEELTSYKEVIENLKPMIQKWQEVCDKDTFRGVIKGDFKEKLNETFKLYQSANKDIVVREDVEHVNSVTPLDVFFGEYKPKTKEGAKILKGRFKKAEQERQEELKEEKTRRQKQRLEKNGRGVDSFIKKTEEISKQRREQAQKYTQEYNNLSVEEKEETRRRAEEEFNYENTIIEQFSKDIINNKQKKENINRLIEITNTMAGDKKGEFLSNLRNKATENKSSKDRVTIDSFFKDYYKEVKKKLENKPRTEQLQEQSQGQRTLY